MWEGRREGWTWGFFILGVSLRAGAMPDSLSRAGQRGTPACHLLTPQPARTSTVGFSRP